MDASGRRVLYDRLWGLLLLATCVLPSRLDGRSQPWQVFARTPELWVRAWLGLGAVVGLFAVVAGFAGWRGRWRHFGNYLGGVLLLGLPLWAPSIWQTFPRADPASLPVGQLASIGWVVLVAITAIYAGSGIRIVRPSQIAGQALAGLGALLLVVFACLPAEGHTLGYALAMLRRIGDLHREWRALLPFGLVALAALVGAGNLVRSRVEVGLARLARLLIVAALFAWIAVPFLERSAAGSGRLARHLPVAWGALRFLAPLFLSLDGCIAFVAISITRSSE